MPVARVKALWDKAYTAADTTRAFSFHRFKAIRDMLSDMGLLEWEEATYQFGKACKWRLGERLMGMVEEALSTPIPSPSSILVCNIVAEAQRERPEQVGLRPRRVFPSVLRTDWDEKLVEAELGRLSRLAARGGNDRDGARVEPTNVDRDSDVLASGPSRQ